ncbi:hypothetical protein Poly51_57440 [Rubripirellula tenax]|uniref:Uncharacterized protein n=1 Tax=Rubripirellula tenax TaxID=2528015 RepID=A0A5C6EBS8_9BACT|nr:hypothetical protein [Rubripirellula tenax]TWU46348.1 hypothetical protein Poly51_57440 [Rubripirellula tenax]
MSTARTFADDLGLNPETVSALQQFMQRRRLLLLLRAVAAAVVVGLICMFVIAIIDFVWLAPDAIRWGLSILAYVCSFAAAWWFGFRHFRQSDPRMVARQLESADPRFREDLLSAVELADPQSANGSLSFRRRLQQSIGRRTAMINVSTLLPYAMIKRWLIAMAVFVAICAILMLIPRAQFARRFARAMLPGLAIERASLTILSIEAPDPPTRFVAEGDAVAVIVSMDGIAADEVTLQWRMADGTGGESAMTPRVARSQDDSQEPPSIRVSNLFAANVLVGNDPVDYRVIAGDAITLWHTLTPLPRPRVVSFEKQLQFPSYAKLEDRVESAEHGDLEALVGTRANVTIRFDEPVADATVRFGLRGPVYQLEPVDGSSEVFQTMIPIKTPNQYQVDATSQRSGLNNPFSPQNTVTPIPDLPPTARWSSNQPTTMLVSPLEVVACAGIMTDDLPMDRVFQEFQVNNRPIQQRDIPMVESSKEIRATWDWDLLKDRAASAETSVSEPTKLAGGDIVRTRLVAIDRLGQRGESPFIELLVADDGFDSDRHRHLGEMNKMATLVLEWTTRAQSILDAVREPLEKSDANEVKAQTEAAEELTALTDGLMKLIRYQSSVSRSLAESRTIELIGRSVLNADLGLRRLSQSAEAALQESPPAWDGIRDREMRQLASRSRSLGQQASRIDQLMRAEFGQQYSLAVAADVVSVQRSLRPLVGDGKEHAAIPIDRFGRYLTVVSGRMEAIDEFILLHQENLPESTFRHFQQQWTQWSDSWTSRIDDAIAGELPEEQLRNLVRQLATETVGKSTHAMNEGRLSSTMQAMTRDLQKELGPLGAAFEAMERDGRDSVVSKEQQQKSKESTKVAEWIRDGNWHEHEFAAARELTLQRIDGEEGLHRTIVSVDLQYAADLNMIGRALDNVSEDGFLPYRDQPASDVMKELAKAIKLVEGGHEVAMSLREIRALWEAERRLDPTVIAKLDHPMWLERFGASLEWPVRMLQQAGVDWKLLEPIDRTRYDADFNKARERISKRRWSDEEFLSGESALKSIEQNLATGLSSIEPQIQEARETIMRYVLSLPEQAAKAAQEIEAAKEQVEQRSDDESPTAETLAKSQDEAQDEVRETLEALVDFANTSELNSDEKRELARDADAAAAQIQDAMKKAEESIESATETTDEATRKESLEQNEAALEKLSEALKQTAEHFEKAAAGEDVSESREAIRKAEQELQIDDEMQKRFDQAKALSNAAESSPKELMEKLERELQRNEPMQEALSDIAQQAAEEAKQSLLQSARDEATIDQALQRSDSDFQESKARAARQLADLARRAATVDQTLLNVGERAASSSESPAALEDVKKARQQLQAAVNQSNQMGGEQAPLSNIRDTAKQMSDAIEQAKTTLEKVGAESAEASEKEIFGDDVKRRENEARTLERAESDVRNQRTRAAQQQRQQWSSVERAAGQRLQQAQREQRDAKRLRDQIESQKKKDKNGRKDLQQRLDQIDEKLEQAKRAETAARESVDFAKDQAKKAQDREKELGRQRLEQLDQPNPAAQMSERMAETAEQELSEIGELLRDVSQQTDIAEQLRANSETAKSLAQQQQNVVDDVAEVAEQLKRAARHEERLEDMSQAKALQEAAESIEQNAATEAAKATRALEQAASEAEQSAKASQNLESAKEAIEKAAEALGRGLANDPKEADAPADAASDASETEQSRAEQLAQTLDELDQAMSDGNQPGESQQSQQAGSPKPPNDSAENPQGSDAPPGGKPTTAGEASPTLASLIESQAQAAARQRQQQLDPSSMGESPPSEPSTDPNTDPFGEPGGGEMPDGSEVDTSEIDRIGAEWGALRERRTDDSTEGPAARVPVQYRREIEAYFRAIARQAAQKDAAK